MPLTEQYYDIGETTMRLRNVSPCIVQGVNSGMGRAAGAASVLRLS